MARPVGSGRPHNCQADGRLVGQRRPDAPRSESKAGRQVQAAVRLVISATGLECSGATSAGRGRRDLRPSLAQPNGLAHAHEELLFAVIVPPPPAAMELEKMRAAALGQGAPFLRDLLECMRGLPFRHGEAVSDRCSRCGSCREHAQATTDCSLLSVVPDYAPNHRHIIVRFRGRQERVYRVERRSGCRRAGQSARGMHAPKTDPPGRGNPGGSR